MSYLDDVKERWRRMKEGRILEELENSPRARPSQVAALTLLVRVEARPNDRFPVFVMGYQMGVTGDLLSLPPGIHEIKVVIDGKVYTRKVDLRENGELVL